MPLARLASAARDAATSVLRAAMVAAGLALAAACGEPRLATEPAPAPGEESPLEPPPGNVTTGEGWQQVSVGRDHSCALTVGGEAYCWGANGASQLGATVSPDLCGPPAMACARHPVRVRTTQRFRMLGAGGEHTCGLTVDGKAYCWGSNAFGQLGTTSPTRAAEPVLVAGGHQWLHVSAGLEHSCGVRADGAALCWGRNADGQLGRGNTLPSSIPLEVRGGLRFTSVATGQGRSCGVATDGSAHCWGLIWLYMDRGLDWSKRQSTPERVPGTTRFRSLSIGAQTTCGITVDDSAVCWESNSFGQMGTGPTTGSIQPIGVAGGLQYTSVSAGGIQSCGVAADRTGWCWGNNTFGQLGDPFARTPCGTARLECSMRPTALAGTLRLVSLATGLGTHACAVTTLSNLYCWGLGTNGQLGDGDARTLIRVAPTRVAARTD